MADDRCRIPGFSHDLVPLPYYLRTKPEPAAQKAAACCIQEKLIAQYTKIMSHVYDMVVKAHEEWEVKSSLRAGVQQTSSMTDAHALVAAVGMGKILKVNLAVLPAKVV